MPANAGIYFNLLMQVAAFEFLQTEEFYFDMLDGAETKALSHNFEVIGFDSIWFMNNMGFMGICLLLFPVMYLIRPILSCCEGNRRVSKIRSYLHVNLYWSMPLRFLIESYIIIVLCSLINF